MLYFLAIIPYSFDQGETSNSNCPIRAVANLRNLRL